MVVVKTATSPLTGQKPFEILYKLPPGTNIVIAIGGRGGMKTYEVSKWVAFSACVRGKRSVILRDEHSLVRESILNEILLRYDTANVNGQLDQYFQKLNTGIKVRATDDMVVFTKGFRASAKEKKANLKSISNIDIAICEEFEDIRDEDQFNTFSDSIRNDGAVIVLVLNTPDINHFIMKRYFNLTRAEKQPGDQDKDVDGYFEITPKDIPGFVCIKTGYEDNGHLPQHIIDKYKSYGDRSSTFYNRFYFNTAIRGLASTGRKGQIITKAKPIKLEDYLKLPFKEYYGQDWGTANPAGTVGVKFDGDNCYARQINYLPKNPKNIAKMYIDMGFTANDIIIADSAEPLSVGNLRNGFRADELSPDDLKDYPKLISGFSVYGVIKPQGSIKTGLDMIDVLRLYIVEESLDFWNEIYNYIWAVDLNGNYTGEPIDDFNHLIDPLRYVVMSRGRYF